MNSHRSISFSDLTIKQLEASPSGALSFRKKIELAKMLDSLGVQVIELPAFNREKSSALLVKSVCSAVKEASLAVPVELSDPDGPSALWDCLREAAHPRMQVSLPVSTVRLEYELHLKPSAAGSLVERVVGECAALCPEVEFIAEDATRCEESFLASLASIAVRAGADIVTVRDDAGALLPDEFASRIAAIRSVLPSDVRLGVWCSNEMYMADSCAVSAIPCGVDELKIVSYGNTTASLKRISQILELRGESLGVSCPVSITSLQKISSRIKDLCCDENDNSLSSLNGVPSRGDSPLFTVHDSLDAVMAEVRALGYDLDENDSRNVYDAFLRLAAQGDGLDSKELDAIVSSVAFQAPPTYTLDNYVVNTGGTISSSCHLRLVKDSRTLESICIGDGPVDAAFQAIEKLLDVQYELDDFQLRSVTEGRSAMGEAVVRLRHNGRLFSGRGISTDIIGSSIMAYLNAVNKIAYEEGQA